MPELLSLTLTMETLGFVEGVLFVIVVYKQPVRQSLAFQSLNVLSRGFPGKISIFVYDNSPQPDLDHADAVEYRHDPANPGVSGAYNQAFNYAKFHRFNYLFLLDQDTSLSEKAFDSYRHSVANYPDLHAFASFAKGHKKFYSPFKLVRGRGVALPHLASGEYSFDELYVINSGLLITAKSFEQAGGYDENFPLDFSDIVFCERLRAQHFKIRLISTTLQHQHSSEAKAVSADRKERFTVYLKALLRYKQNSNPDLSYWFSGFPQAIKLSRQYYDLSFLRTFLSQRQ